MILTLLHEYLCMAMLMGDFLAHFKTVQHGKFEEGIEILPMRVKTLKLEISEAVI